MTIEQLIGNTPLVAIESLTNENVKVYAKLEGQNPGGSVKDRAALNMISEALGRKEIQKGDTIIEATSGNTGIALAMVAQRMGLNLVLTMPENSTMERVKTMRAYGAEVILTPAEKTIEYSRELAMQMSKENGYFVLNQFDNPDNYLAHVKTTGPEIWKDTNESVSHFVSAMGTTGTISGVGTFLKDVNQHIKIIGAQPKEGSNIPGIRKWSKEFLPKIYQSQVVDDIQYVSREDADKGMRFLAKEEGIFGGISSGGAFHIATNIAKNIQEGCVVFIVCDRGDRYLSELEF